jgi:hypothetical protein
MEIKLTSDWIFLHNCEIHCLDGDCYITIFGEFQNYLAELALKTMNVEYDYEELYGDGDVNFDDPYFRYSFNNIEDIKDTCPELYLEFQKSIQIESERQARIND